MPTFCSMIGCPTGRAGRHLVKDPDIGFHRFPVKNAELCKRWLNFCGVADANKRKNNVSGGSRVCSIHFAPDAYERDLQNELLGLPPRKRLRADAVPTITGLDDEKKPISEAARKRAERRKEKERKEFVEQILAASEEQQKRVEEKESPIELQDCDIDEMKSEQPEDVELPKRDLEYCFICNCASEQLISDFRPAKKDSGVTCSTFADHAAQHITNQLHTIFILRNVLEVSSEMVQVYLRTLGSPENWISLCPKCNEKIDQIAKVHEVYVSLRQKLNKLKSEVIQIVKKEGGGCSGNNKKGRSRWDLPMNKGLETVAIASFARDVREFVFRNEYDHLTNHCEVGDIMAMELEVDQRLVKRPQSVNVSQKFPEIKKRLQEQRKAIIPETVKEEVKEVEQIVEDAVDAFDDFEIENLGSTTTTMTLENPRVAGRKKRSQVKRKKINCPFCTAFTGWADFGDRLCEHLEKCEKLKSISHECSDSELDLLRCPSCKVVYCPISDKRSLGEHLTVCTGSKSSMSFPMVPFRQRIFECDLCKGGHYWKMKGFIEHYSYHRSRPFKCTACNRRSAKGLSDSRWMSKHIPHNPPGSDPSTWCIEDARVPTIPWWCPHCPMNFTDETSRETHMKDSHADKLTSSNMRVVCQHCLKEFLCVDELRFHEGIEHAPSKKRFSCNHCDMNPFPNKVSLRLHMRTAHGLGFCICDSCGKRFVSEGLLKLHMIRQHGPNATKSIPGFQCDTCDRCFQSKKSLAVHRMIVHENKSPYPCHLCQAGRTSKRSLQRHLTTVHKIGNHHKKFICPEEGCLRAFNTQHRLNEHVAFHKKMPGYKCDKCGKTFYIRGAYIRHKLLHNDPDKAKFICDKCPRKFIRADYFKLHQKRHEEVEAGLRTTIPLRRTRNAIAKINTQHKCSICEETFSGIRQLKSHLSNIHGTELPKDKGCRYQCELCGKKITHPAGMKAHLAERHGIIKEGLKVFKCPEEGCDTEFYYKPKLDEHISRHRGEPRYHCSYCGKGLYNKVHLIRHELSIHVNKDTRPFQCKEKDCGKTFPIRAYLRLHERTHERKAMISNQEAKRTVTTPEEFEAVQSDLNLTLGLTEFDDQALD